MIGYSIRYTNTLYHHGILGQKWGVRRFQNKDGSLTGAGRKRYDEGVPKSKGQDDKHGSIKIKLKQSDSNENRPLTDAEKAEAIRTMNYKEIVKHQDQFSTKELQDLRNRGQQLSALGKQAAESAKEEFSKKPVVKAFTYGKQGYDIAKGFVNEVLSAVKMYDDVMTLADRVSGNGGTP